MKKLIATLAIVGAMGTSGLFAQTGDSIEDLSITSSFAYESQYVFRGVKLEYDSFQPSLEFGFPVVGGDLYAGIWTNLPITNKGPMGNDNEIDIYAGYAYPITDMVTLDAGFIYYWYANAPATAPATSYVEPYVGASFDVLLSPAIYVYYSIDQLQKAGGSGPDSGILTIEASIGYSFDLSEYVSVEGFSFDVGAYLGMGIPNDSSAMNGTTSFLYAGVTGDLVYAFSENVSASIGVRYSNYSQSGTAYTGTTGYAPTIGNQNNIWMGASVGFAY
ncbi:MAG: TorF family putative porin [Puniceicoccales bacterium]